MSILLSNVFFSKGSVLQHSVLFVYYKFSYVYVINDAVPRNQEFNWHDVQYFPLYLEIFKYIRRIVKEWLNMGNQYSLMTSVCTIKWNYTWSKYNQV